MTIEIRPLLSGQDQTKHSSSFLLIQKSLFEQRLKEARKHLNAWELEREKRYNESCAYMARIKELWLDGKWDDKHYKKLCELSSEASRMTGRFTAEIGYFVELIDKINTKLGL